MPQTLLLADDSVTIQRVIELTFADEDINVLAVSDGDQAIERINANPPDIVLVDVGMPGRSGYEVARHIKESPRLQHIPVLLLTGAFEPVDEATAASVGCDGVLAKPFEPQLVIARVRDLLGRPVSAESADTAPVMNVQAMSAPARGESVASVPVADVWGERPVAPASDARPEQIARLDSYFAKLDEAFSTLGGNGGSDAPAPSPADPAPIAAMVDWFGATPTAPSAAVPDLQLTPEPVIDQEPITQFDSTLQEFSSDDFEPPSEAMPAVPLSRYEVPLFPSSPDAPVISVDADITPEQASEVPFELPAPVPEHTFEPLAIEPRPAFDARVGASLPALPDAFAAILAAEQYEPMPSGAPVWPASVSAPGPVALSNGGGALGEEAIETITRLVLERMSDRVVRETVSDLVSAIAERLVREEIERIKDSIR